jgi:hypothetical protein
MSDDPPNERRSSRRGDVGSEPARVEDAPRGKAGRRELPSLDEVFLDDDEVDLGEEDTQSVLAVDALGLQSLSDMDEQTEVLDSSRFDPPPPSSTRLSAPPMLSARPRVSAPPMPVSQVRPPTGAPPPFVAPMPTIDLGDDIEYAPPDDYDSSPDAQLLEAEPTPAPGEYVEADLYSEPIGDQRPAAQPAQALRASAAPWGVSRHSADASLDTLFAAAHSRPQGLTPPPRPSLSPRLPSVAPPLPSHAFTPSPPHGHAANAAELPPLAPAPDHFKVPKTLVSGPPLELAPEPFPLPYEAVRKSRAGGVALALLAAILAGAGFWFLESTQPGSLLLEVRTQANAPVAGLALYLDGELICRAAPCEVAELARGTHFVRVEAEGFPATADHAVVVRPRERTRHEVVLERLPGDGRVSISTAVPGFRVTLDGQVRGLSPLEITELDPGEHTLLLEKEGFEASSETIVVERGRVLSVRSSPELLQGKLEVVAAPGSEDAEVRLDGELVALPIERSLDAARAYSLTASKPGRAQFEKQIQFTQDQPTIVLRLDLPEGDGETSVSSTAGKTRPNDSTFAASSGKATLNFNSLPRSMVLLDGRPLGQTPQMGVQVSPGSHNVVFVHPERGRKPIQVDVDAGAKRTVSVRF